MWPEMQINGFRTVLHFDKKWFYIVHGGKKVWELLYEENMPPPKVQQKAFIRKFVFFAVVSP